MNNKTYYFIYLFRDLSINKINGNLSIKKRRRNR